MSQKKLSKQVILELKKEENRKFNKQTIIGFSIAFTVIMVAMVFYTYGCDTMFAIRQYSLFQKALSTEKVCMIDNQMKRHSTDSYLVQQQKIKVCGKNCESIMEHHVEEVLRTDDAFSHEQITKSTAIIGLKKKGNPELVYFKNKRNFEKYYRQNH